MILYSFIRMCLGEDYLDWNVAATYQLQDLAYLTLFPGLESSQPLLLSISFTTSFPLSSPSGTSILRRLILLIVFPRSCRPSLFLFIFCSSDWIISGALSSSSSFCRPGYYWSCLLNSSVQSLYSSASNFDSCQCFLFCWTFHFVLLVLLSRFH